MKTIGKPTPTPAHSQRVLARNQELEQSNRELRQELLWNQAEIEDLNEEIQRLKLLLLNRHLLIG